VIERRIGQQRTTIVEIANSYPELRWCSERGRNIEEQIDLSGYQPRGNRIPIIDGDRSSIRNVVGSLHGVTVRDKQLIGNVVFARDKRSQVISEKYRDGHLQLFEAELMPLAIVSYPDRDVVKRFEVLAMRIKAAAG
jgi:hypothetical protein